MQSFSKIRESCGLTPQTHPPTHILPSINSKRTELPRALSHSYPLASLSLSRYFSLSPSPSPSPPPASQGTSLCLCLQKEGIYPTSRLIRPLSFVRGFNENAWVCRFPAYRCTLLRSWFQKKCLLPMAFFSLKNPPFLKILI